MRSKPILSLLLLLLLSVSVRAQQTAWGQVAQEATANEDFRLGTLPDGGAWLGILAFDTLLYRKQLYPFTP